MEKGDLKGYLKKIKGNVGGKIMRSLSSKSKNERDDTKFESMMEWCMQVQQLKAMKHFHNIIL